MARPAKASIAPMALVAFVSPKGLIAMGNAMPRRVVQAGAATARALTVPTTWP